MFSLTPEHIFTLVQTYGYEIILPTTIIAGPIVAIMGGYLASLGDLNIFSVFFALLIGDVIGDTMYYALGKWGRYGFIKRFGKYFFLPEEKIKHLEIYFQRHDWKILFFGKTQPIGSAILVAAGVANMPYAPFMAYNIISSIPKIIFLEIIGYYFGNAYGQVQHLLNVAAIGSVMIAILFIFVYVGFQRYIKKRGSNIDKI